MSDPNIPAPSNTGEMSREPARKIGEYFADKVMIRPIIAAVAAMVAQAFQATVDDELVDNITLVVTFVAMIYAAWSANTGAASRATKQAAVTREAVYSPATTQKIATLAARTGDDTLPPPPAQ